MDYFKVSLSTIEHILKRNDYIIEHKDNSSIVHNTDSSDTLIEVSHDLIKLYLTDNKKYKSYNLFTSIYNTYKDKNTEYAKLRAKQALDAINNIIHIYSTKYLYIELKNRNKINLNFCV